MGVNFSIFFPLFAGGCFMFPLILILGFITLIIISAVFGHAQKQKRIEDLGRWAASLGLNFEHRKNSNFDQRFAEFKCFQLGNNRYAHYLTHGVFEGRQVHAFDYHYETQSTRTVSSTDSKGRTSTRTETVTHYHDFSAVILEPNVRLKPLLIRPEGFGDRIASFFGKNDLDFESAEFSRRYHVSADDRRWAYDVLHARTLEFILGYPSHTIEFASGRVLVMRDQRRMDAAQFHEALRLIDGILDALPDYLKEQQSETYA